MNINLKNRTIFTKILLGFVLILAFAALIGGVLFYSLGSVIGALHQITEQNAPSIQYPTGVERYTLRAILNEKTYLLLGKKEVHQQAQRDIQEIYTNLNRMDEVASKYSDQGLLQKSRDVHQAVERYQGRYNRAIDFIGENQRLADNMRMLGTKVYDLSHGHTLEHKRLLEKAITDGMDQKKYMEGLLLCNEIEKEVLEARREEKNFLLYKKQEHFEKFKSHIDSLIKLLKEISRVDYILEHQPLIEETRKAADKYLMAIEKWGANDNELRAMLAEMHQMGLRVQETAQTIQEAGWQGMDTNKAIAVIKTKRAIITGSLVAVITLITGILAAFFIARGIAAPIKELKQTTDRISEGDLKHRVRITSSDEIGVLGISFNKMAENLQNTMVSRDYFENVIRSTLDTLIVLDKEAKIETVNPATCELLGYTEEELIGQPASILFAEEEEEEVYRVFQFFREPEKAGLIQPQDTIRNRELTYKTKDGRLIPMLFNASVIFDKTGNVTGVVAGAKDITDLKLAEAEIRKEKTLSENIIATIPDSLLVLDKDLRIKRANRSFYEVFGEDRGKAIGARITDILGDEDGRLSTRLNRLFGTKENIEYFELHYPSKKQGERIFHIKARNVIFAEEEEEEEEELLVITDITERKRAEQALRESEEKYRSLVNNIKLGIFRSTPGPHGKFIEVNLAMEEMTGYSRGELLSMNVSDLYVRPEEREKVVQEVASSTGKTTTELNFRKKDGTEIVVSDTKVPVRDHTGKVLYFDGIIEDITGRKESEREKAALEEQFRQSQKMEAIGRLAGGVAHDFNNLLTIIKGNSQLSLMEMKADDPLRGNIEEIHKASDRAATLTRQLLAFSRRQILEMKVLDLNTTLRELEKMLHRVIGEDVELVTYMAEDLGRIKADPGQIEQVIMNLAVNARDAMPRGGKLTIETANLVLDEAYARRHVAVKPGHYVMLSVSDTGVGMTPEVKERIFEPFFTTKEKGKGTGLGLSTVYGIVKQSGGNIWVYSEPGQGATFKLYFPRVDEPLDEMEKKVVQEELSRGSETILVVEDNDEVRKLAVRVLEKQGYNVLEASTGEEALLLCKSWKEPIHLLLIDVVMPGMSGWELVEKLRYVRGDFKALFMSGYTDNTIAHHGVLEKGVNYIQKPFTVEGLARKVRGILNKRMG
jgi:PAS domain S-box-containing protein